MANTETIIIIVFVIVVLIIGGVLIYYFFFRHKGGNEGDVCTSNEDCSTGHFCGGDGRCHTGSSGRASGAACTETSQCQIGLTCTNSVCTSSTPPPPTDLIPSFNNSQVTTQINGTTYYLVIGPANTSMLESESSWSTTKPNTTLSWSSSRLEAVATGDVSGDVSINVIGQLVAGAASKLFFVRRADKTISVEDQFSNVLQYAPSVTMPTVFNALFFNPNQYIDQTPNMRGTSTVVAIVPDSSA